LLGLLQLNQNEVYYVNFCKQLPEWICNRTL